MPMLKRDNRITLSPSVIIGGVLVLAIVAIALISLVWTPYDPIHANPSEALEGSSPAHLMGTDRYGRDVFSQIMAGAQITLLVGLGSVLIGAVVGVTLGIIAGIYRGLVEKLIMGCSELMLAFPALLIAIIASAVWGSSTFIEILAIGIAFIPSFARVSRTATRRIVSLDYIASARSAGLGWFSIARRHILRGLTGLVIVQASVSIALAILAEAGLSFLGLGTPAPAPSWGRMLHNSQVYLDTHWTLALWPGLAIAVTVLGFNTLGDGLRDALDPFSESPRRRSRPNESPLTPSGNPGAGTADHATDRSPSALVEISNLTILDDDSQPLVSSMNLTLRPGDRLGLIGESGSGKSLTASAIMGFLPENLHTVGSVHVAGHEMLGAREKDIQGVRGTTVAMVFQEPMTSLNPLMRVGKQIEMAIKEPHSHTGASAAATSPTAGKPEDKTSHETAQKLTAQSRTARAYELLESVGLKARTFHSYPFELSGGQRQRVLIAMAFANNPQVLICDEPTTALDVTVQKSILKLLDTLIERHNTALLMISHDLSVIARTCTDVLVMDKGETIERGSVESILTQPAHEYTSMLVEAAQATSLAPHPASQPEAHKSHPDSQSEAHKPHAGTSASAKTPPRPLIEVKGVSKNYTGRRNLTGATAGSITALKPTDLTIYPGEKWGIVGESGSGKSTLLSLIAGLAPPTTGEILIDGSPVSSPRHISSIVQTVFQDPRGSFDPTMTIGQSLAEPMLARKGEFDRRRREERIKEVLHQVGIDESAIHRYPHEFSGGQRQRMSIARALTVKPRILLADEPVSALDVSVRAKVLEVLSELADEYDLTMVFVSHDLGVVKQVCDHVAVIKDGEIVERGETEAVYSSPTSEYARELLGAAVAPMSFSGNTNLR